MKRIIIYIAALTALVFTPSCSRETLQGSLSDGDSFYLQVVWSELATRADEGVAGIENENQVTSLDWYFFDATTSSAVFHYRENVSDATAQKYEKDFIPGTEYGGSAFPHRSDLCGTNGYCTVFVIANLPESKVPASMPTLEEIKSVTVDKTFLSNETRTESDGTRYFALETSDTNLNFIMTGEKQVKGTTAKVADATAEVVELNRLAAKITFDIKILKSKALPAVVYEEGSDLTYTETWTPMLNGENVRAYVQNAINKAKLGVADENHFMTVASGDVFNYASEYLPLDANPSMWTLKGNYYETNAQVGPFYTYPNNWEEGGTDTFVKIVVPWKVTKVRSDNVLLYSSQREVYYKVMLPNPEVLANTWYNLTVTLEPGTENEPEVVIDATYQVVNWTTGGASGVNDAINDIKYLVVDYSNAVVNEDTEEKEFIFYDKSYNVQYSASGPVGFKILDVYCDDYSTQTGGTIDIVKDEVFGTGSGAGGKKLVGTSTNGTNWATVGDLNAVKAWFTCEGKPNGHLDLNHWLNNDLTSNYFDATPYTFKVQLYLLTDSSVNKEFTLIQMPQTLVIPQKNTGNDIESLNTLNNVTSFTDGTIYSSGVTSSDTDMGFVFVNGQHNRHYVMSETAGLYRGSDGRWYTNNNWQGTRTPYYQLTIASDGNYYYFDSAVGLTGLNKNPNRYIIRTSVISDANKSLGDPRISGVDNISGGNPAWVNAPALSGESPRVLSYYKRTESSARTQDMIAPSFMVASSYGVTTKKSYDDASRRCASYQEDGYPAGRWRLPTAAEIEYCVTLSAKGRIPVLFGNESSSTETSYYWSSNGYVEIVTPAGTVTPHLDDFSDNRTPRCVYDTWYWGEEKVSAAQHTFMWGDEQ